MRLQPLTNDGTQGDNHSSPRPMPPDRVFFLAVEVARSSEIWVPYLGSLVGEMALGLRLKYAMIGELSAEEPRRFSGLAFWANGKLTSGPDFETKGTPFDIANQGHVELLRGARSSFPGFQLLFDYGIESVIAVTVIDSAGSVVGLLALMDDGPLTDWVFPSVGLEAIARSAGAEIERRRALEKLRDSESRFRDFYENAPLAYFTVSADGFVQGSNRRARDLLGYSEAEIRGKHVLELYADSDDGRSKALILLSRFQAGDVIEGEELQMRRSDGASIWISLTVEPILDEDGRVIASRSAVVDMSARRLLEAELREQARHDSLTRTLNHAAIIEALQTQIVTNPLGELTVCMVDLDDFKLINDGFGHLAGDAVLKEVARALETPHATVGRYGGDEFLVILVASLSEAMNYRREVEERLACLELENGEVVCAKASFGFAHYQNDAQSGLELIRIADAAMYEARGIPVRNSWVNGIA